MNVTSDAPSWKINLGRTSGFWGDAAWYDHNIERKLPLTKDLLEECVCSLPPCSGAQVLDLCAGSGRVSFAIASAYPTVKLTLLERSAERLELAKARLAIVPRVSETVEVCCSLNVSELDGTKKLPSTPDKGFDVIVAMLALRHIVQPPEHYGGKSDPLDAKDIEDRYKKVFSTVLASLAPGGTFIIGDHEGLLSCFNHSLLLHELGFIDVDVAWRQRDFFLVGGCRPN